MNHYRDYIKEYLSKNGYIALHLDDLGDIWIKKIYDLYKNGYHDEHDDNANDTDDEDNDQDLALYYGYVGTYYRINGDVDKMLKYYLMAIDKGNTMAMNNLACYYKEQRNYDSAKKYYLMAIENGSHNAMNDLACCYMEQGKYDSAIKYYLMAIENGNRVAIHNLAFLYEKEGKYDLALKYYFMSVEQNDVAIIRHLKLFFPNPKILQAVQKIYQEKQVYETEIKRLQDQVTKLTYRPKGPGYFEAKREF